MSASERFERYLDYLRKKTDITEHEQYIVIQFYKAHFCHQLCDHCLNLEHSRHWQEQALCYYQNYLEVSNRLDESRYYAQWQVGMLQDVLNYPWCQAEDSLLKALNIDPLRAEPLKKLVDHYMRAKQWKIAYSFSAKTLNEHFDRNPVANRRWFIDFDAYNWNVVNKHCAICYKLGYLAEAEKTYNLMMQYELQHLDEFKASDIRHIHILEKIFHASRPALATAS